MDVIKFEWNDQTRKKPKQSVIILNCSLLIHMNLHVNRVCNSPECLLFGLFRLKAWPKKSAFHVPEEERQEGGEGCTAGWFSGRDVCLSSRRGTLNPTGTTTKKTTEIRAMRKILPAKLKALNTTPFFCTTQSLSCHLKAIFLLGSSHVL